MSRYPYSVQTRDTRHGVAWVPIGTVRGTIGGTIGGTVRGTVRGYSAQVWSTPYIIIIVAVRWGHKYSVLPPY
jgi:hypothetical protein